MTELSLIEKKRHTLAHLLAAAVLKHYPHAKLAIGPAIEYGFYYDIDFTGGNAPGDSDLRKIEKEMKKMLPSWKVFTHEEVSAADARASFSDNPYKLELIDEIDEKGEPVTLYTAGDFTDLCRGGHADNPAEDIDARAFTLTSIAGAYWRGDEENAMLTRIYGVAFETPAELETYQKQQEEARARDHRKLGKELGIFTTSELVGAGLPLLQPKGAHMRRLIEEYLWELHAQRGYDRVWTPHIAKEALYETSGHAEKFGDELFRVRGKEDDFIMKPMNCPHHMQIFADNQFSYRDMPVRYFEPATVYRDEKSGQLGGLTRVRAITQDDGHLFCRPSQIAEEVGTIVEIIKQFFTTFGMVEDYWVSLSVRGDDRSKYLGSDEMWEQAEEALEAAATEHQLPFTRTPGEAAFYGPKLDFMFKDSIGREWQLSTIQCDFNLPQRFELSYINEKGEKERPVVIHRAISGSLERFMGMMIEHFAGAFPLWLSAEQIRIIPVSASHHEYAAKVHEELRAVGVRATFDDSNETLGKKIRAAKKAKLPYCIVIGDKEVADKQVTLESRAGESTYMSLSAVANHLRSEIETKTL